jgi:NTP pyrophosphatase (non-canonical NTP hydrolase)
MSFVNAMTLIYDERQRQDQKWGWPNNGLAGTDLHKKVSILLEEVGEVANAVLELDWDNLEKELVQVAAVAVAWLESFELFDPRTWTQEAA